jgi:hypothetical protein
MQQTNQQLRDRMEQADKDQFLSWKDHPVTELLMDLLKARKENLKEMWAGGDLSGPSFQEMAIRNSAAVGACSAYNDILNIDYQSLNGDSDD